MKANANRLRNRLGAEAEQDAATPSESRGAVLKAASPGVSCTQARLANSAAGVCPSDRDGRNWDADRGRRTELLGLGDFRSG